MTRRISLSVVAAFAVMAIATPAALAGNVHGANVDAHQRALGGTLMPSYPDAFERAVGRHQLDGAVLVPTYADAFERAVARQRLGGAALAGDSNGRFDLADSPLSVTTVSSGGEIEWPQIGIGFGVGILLAVAFWGAMRIRHIRPLAH